MALNELGSVSVLGLKSTEGSMIGSYCICEGLSRLSFILSMFFSGLVFGCSCVSSCGGVGSSLRGDLTGEVGCGEGFCACENVFMRCAITELRTGFSGTLEGDL